MRLIEIKITLLDTRPPVWRNLLLSPEIPLDQLHRITQAAMGWKDAHLHRFRASGKRYSDPRFELEDGSTDEHKVLVGSIFTKPGDLLSYEYDFGDNWQHELRCEGFAESDVSKLYAVCTGGARACPPEDCGGVPGYKDSLRIRASRGLKPEAFSLDETNDRLSRLFRREGSPPR